MSLLLHLSDISDHKKIVQIFYLFYLYSHFPIDQCVAQVLPIKNPVNIRVPTHFECSMLLQSYYCSTIIR